MYFDSKKSTGRTFWLLAIINLVNYACFHALYNLSTGEAAPALVEVFYYLNLVLTKCSDFILPVIIASVTLLLYGRCEGRRWLISTLLLSVSVIFYSYPYYYIYHIERGFTTPEALGLSALVTLVSILTLAIHSLLLFLAAYLYVRLDKKDGSARERLAMRTVYTERLDFKRGAGFMLFLISLCEMIFRVAVEIYETAVFFKNVGLTVSTEEVLTVIISYLLIIGLFVLCVFLCDAILRYKFKNDFYEVIDDADRDRAVE